MSRHVSDLAAEMELDAYDSESCPNGHHPSLVGRVAPVVVLCEICASVEQLQETQKPGPGQHIVLVTVEEARRRAKILADLNRE